MSQWANENKTSIEDRREMVRMRIEERRSWMEISRIFRVDHTTVRYHVQKILGTPGFDVNGPKDEWIAPLKKPKGKAFKRLDAPKNKPSYTYLQLLAQDLKKRGIKKSPRRYLHDMGVPFEDIGKE